MNTKEKTVSSRRSFLATVGQIGAVIGLTQLLPMNGLRSFAQEIKGKVANLIVRSKKPLDLETPVSMLTSWLTPTDMFYVRSHFYTPPASSPDQWQLAVDGEVAQPLTLSLNDLKQMPKVTVTVTLECAGNGRAFFEPAVAGIQWEKGAVGNAQWTGVRLADVLKKAGAKPTGKFVILDGADTGIAKAPDFIRQVPMDKAMHPDTLIAYEMNGQPLLDHHGAPLRAIVPGWEGAYAVKWLNHIQVSVTEHDGAFVQSGYRYPARPVAPGAAVDAKDMVPLTGLAVKSLITAPTESSSVKAGSAVRISGFAWAGESNVTRVDLSFDGGTTWQQAKLGRDQARYAWRQFEYEWKPAQAGSFLILSRATDDKGRVQPVVAQWNPSGYLWNVIDRVRINVEA